ncbi:internal head protein [Erwinia phage AH04]|uniref:Internal head protein n=1 Tax=Erwinia phage AH04 TaxID=2869569 RepID=A0AAE7X0K1_9CAUD|nr:internal head protein [Erwinia phage AH04]QZA70594.1 internal head protein [Erwinia phage AH04]
MSQKLIPSPKEPIDSTDYIYGERMEPYEGRMNFFLNEKVDVKKDNVKEEDKEKVDGLESVLQRFASYGAIVLPNLEEERVGLIVDGQEAANNVKKVIHFLVQLAKDAVDFLLNLVNNRIARLDNREYRVSLNRKRDGIVSEPVKYPATVRRLFDPLTMSLDPNWVTVSLNNVNRYYDDTVDTYRALTNLIRTVDGEGFDLTSQIDKTIDVVKQHMGIKESADSFSSKIIPGNRQLVIDTPTPDNLNKVGIYFQNSTVPVKLLSPEYEPSGPMVDGVLATVRKTIKNIRSNQSTVSQLYRTFEKEAKAYELGNKHMTPDQRAYLNWLVRFNKRLMTVNLQYVLTAMDSGLDFVNSGLRK